jgi:tetratricopeptide (TPR) repeat protein
MSEQSELDEAVEHFNQALDHARSGQFNEAVAQLGEAIRLNPRFASAYLYRGFFYYDRAFAERVRNAAGAGIPNPKDLEQAIADYSIAIELGANDGNSYYERGVTYARLRDVCKMGGGNAGKAATYDTLALNDLDQAIAMQPKIALAYYERGLINAGRNKRTAAIGDYGEAIRLQPDHALAYYNRALMYMREKSERNKAIADLEMVLKISKDSSLTMDAESLLKQLRGGWFSNLFH